MAARSDAAILASIPGRTAATAVWPPIWDPPTPGWQYLMARRALQILDSPSQQKLNLLGGLACSGTSACANFTERGYATASTPAALQAALLAAVRDKKTARRPEVEPLVGGGGSADLLVVPKKLLQRLADELKPLHEQWAGRKLVLTSAYGPRAYKENSRLALHTDRPDSHVISSIVHIDRSEDGAAAWPLVIEGFDGRANEVLLAPGEMLFYESAKCLHGRPYPLNGSSFVAIFLHFKPTDWKVDLPSLLRRVADDAVHPPGSPESQAAMRSLVEQADDHTPRYAALRAAAERGGLESSPTLPRIESFGGTGLRSIDGCSGDAWWCSESGDGEEEACAAMDPPPPPSVPLPSPPPPPLPRVPPWGAVDRSTGFVPGFNPLEQRCDDARPDCEALAGPDRTGCALNPHATLIACPRACGSCAFRKLVHDAMRCLDAEAACEQWAAAGECESNPQYMGDACTVSCGLCEAKRRLCERTPLTPVVPAGGGLDALFNRLLEDREVVDAHAPVVLSRSPWVLQLEDLVSADEAGDLIALCDGKWMASRAGSEVTSYRTSSLCWCDGPSGCRSKPIARRISERVRGLIGMPENHTEFFQLLKYQPGQYYKRHHDMWTNPWCPPGVRLLTFFLYLSTEGLDVDGGGTRFNELNLTVLPRLGRGVMWTNYADDTWRADPRTHHEALPVDRGVKYALNIWAHQHDLQTRRGQCAYSGRANVQGGEWADL